MSEGSPPGLMPMMKRPSSRVSSIATVVATVTGCELERFSVPVPSLMRLVSCTSEARNVAQEVIDSAASVACSPTKASA